MREKLDPRVFQAVGLILIALSVPVALGIVGPWPVAWQNWEYAEVRGITAPETLEPGATLDLITIRAYNGWKREGEILVNIHVEGYPSWQVTKLFDAYEEREFAFNFYRKWPVMTDKPLVIRADTINPNHPGASVTIHPAGTSPPEPQTEALTPEGARDLAVEHVLASYPDNVESIQAPTTWSTEDLTPEGLLGHTTLQYTSGIWAVKVRYPVVLEPAYEVEITVDGDPDFMWSGAVSQGRTVSGDVKPTPISFEAIGEAVQDAITEYAPYTLTRNVVLGGFAALAGLGFIVYGFSLRHEPGG